MTVLMGFFVWFSPQGEGKVSLHLNHKWNLCICIGSALNLVFWVYHRSDVELKAILASNSPPNVSYYDCILLSPFLRKKILEMAFMYTRRMAEDVSLCGS